MIGDDLRADLPELRAQAESLMTATGQIGMLIKAYNRTTNAMVQTINPVAYTGKMRVWRGNASSVASTGGQMVTTNPLLCSLPWDTAGITTHMAVKVTTSSDPDLVGKIFPIKDISRHEQAVRRLLTLVDDQG